MTTINTNVGSPGTIGPASGGSVLVYNNISTIPLVVIGSDPQRQSLTFYNPGNTDIYVAPVSVQTTGSDIPLVPSASALGGCFIVSALGGFIAITGECQKPWQAFSASGDSHPLTVTINLISTNLALQGAGGGGGGGNAGQIFISVEEAEGSIIVANTQSIQTLFYAPDFTNIETLTGGGQYVRASLATITAAGYLARSYFRSTDRFMPDGTINTTNGGYWLLYDDEPIPQMLGLIDDSASVDQTVIFQAWVTHCGIQGKPINAPVPAYIKITDTVTFPTEATIDIRNIRISYSGTRDRAVLFVPVANFKSMWFGRIESLTIDWSSDNFVGIYLHDVNSCDIHLSYTARFTRPYGLFATNGAPYNRIWPGRVADGKYNETLTSLGPAGFINENSFYSGDYRSSSAATGLGTRYGTHVSAAVGGYSGHNNNRWINPTYELGNATSGTDQATPFFFDGAGAFNVCENARAENNNGVLVICNGSNVRFNEIGFSYTATGALQINAIQEVNSANSNRLNGIAGGETRRAFTDLRRLLSSSGGANVPYVSGDVFVMESTSGLAKRSTTSAGRLLSNALALELQTGVMAVMVAVDTSKIKLWRLSGAFAGSVTGNVLAIAFDAAGTRLTGNATDPAGDEKYIKNSNVGWATTAAWGGGYTGGSLTSDIFSIRAEVQTMWIGIYSSPVQSMELVGYMTQQTVAGARGNQSIETWVPLDDDGSVQLASANPGTAGTHGYYSKGHVVYNTGAASGQPQGWQCSTAGWLADPWAAGALLPTIGRIQTNDGGKMYQLITAGTCAGSGGPTGTGAGIVDNTCVWNYVGVTAVFSALPNLP